MRGAVTALGIEKLLGAGKATKAITIKVERWSKNAEEKIKKAGGKLEFNSPRKPEEKATLAGKAQKVGKVKKATAPKRPRAKKTKRLK